MDETTAVPDTIPAPAKRSDADLAIIMPTSDQDETLHMATPGEQNSA